jgi:hypothetical protein
MARTSTHPWPLCAAILALASAGCDPYPAKNTTAPQIVTVFASNGPNFLEEVEGTKTDTGWTITIPSGPGRMDPTVIQAVEPVIFVQTNQSLDGASIQTSDGDCTPSGGWLSVTPPTLATPGSPVWYSCYHPSAVVGLEGGSVVLFRATQSISTTLGQGWFDVASLDPDTSFSLSGNVRDRSGGPLPISIQVTVSPPP